jgi:hypothetical protein
MVLPNQYLYRYLCARAAARSPLLRANNTTEYSGITCLKCRTVLLQTTQANWTQALRLRSPFDLYPTTDF